MVMMMKGWASFLFPRLLQNTINDMVIRDGEKNRDRNWWDAMQFTHRWAHVERDGKVKFRKSERGQDRDGVVMCITSSFHSINGWCKSVIFNIRAEILSQAFAFKTFGATIVWFFILKPWCFPQLRCIQMQVHKIYTCMYGLKYEKIL